MNPTAPPTRVLRSPVPDGYPRRSSLDASVHFVAQTFIFRSASVDRPAPGAGIIAISVFRPHEQPLALLVDLQAMNRGASLTNVADRAINFVGQTAMPALGADCSKSAWVELDSEGCFDLMHAQWPFRKRMGPPPTEPPMVTFAPLRHNDMPLRTLGAFLARFPELGPALWHETSIHLAAISPNLLKRS